MTLKTGLCRYQQIKWRKLKPILMNFLPGGYFCTSVSEMDSYWGCCCCCWMENTWDCWEVDCDRCHCPVLIVSSLGWKVSSSHFSGRTWSCPASPSQACLPSGEEIVSTLNLIRKIESIYRCFVRDRDWPIIVSIRLEHQGWIILLIADTGQQRRVYHTYTYIRPSGKITDFYRNIYERFMGKNNWDLHGCELYAAFHIMFASP